MDLRQFITLIDNMRSQLVATNLTHLSDNTLLKQKFQHIFSLAAKVIPEHRSFIESVDSLVMYYSIHDAIEALDYLMELLAMEIEIGKKIESGKIFESAEDKLRQAATALRNSDLPSVLNSLNTSLELVLKDELDIPTTITQINTANVIEVLIATGIGPIDYLNEVKRRVTSMDNEVKHRGYVPSQKECVLALKAMEELFSKLKKNRIQLTDELRGKIYDNLYSKK